MFRVGLSSQHWHVYIFYKWIRCTSTTQICKSTFIPVVASNNKNKKFNKNEQNCIYKYGNSCEIATNKVIDAYDALTCDGKCSESSICLKCILKKRHFTAIKRQFRSSIGLKYAKYAMKRQFLQQILLLVSSDTLCFAPIHSGRFFSAFSSDVAR